MISYNAYDKLSSKEFREANAELMEIILKDNQEVVYIDDHPDEMIQSAKNYIEARREIEGDDIGLFNTAPINCVKLLKELEENKEIFDNHEEENKNIGLSSFIIMEKIGEGAFGQVFKSKLEKTNKTYAMKSISKKHLVKTKQIKYALSECKILKQMDHQFIIKMHYAFQTVNYIHFILDLCEGGDLSMHIQRKEIFDEDEAKFYIAELILAVEHLHSKNIIYRDMKPENILIGIL